MGNEAKHIRVGLLVLNCGSVSHAVNNWQRFSLADQANKKLNYVHS
jgi:hypothetical protein